MPDSAHFFLRLTFEGGRFVEHSAPVEALAELATVQQLVVRVARALYLQRHQSRKRVPRGFWDGAQLHLTTTEHNCFTTVLERPGAWSGPLIEDDGVFDDASILTIAALSAVAEGNPIPDEFPKSAHELLASLGKRLGDSESILVKGRNAPGIARVNEVTRAHLAKLIRAPLERQEMVEGEVDQVDDATSKCFIRDRRGYRTELPFTIDQREMIVDAFAQRPIARIRARGPVISGVTRRMKSVDDIEAVDDERALDVMALWDRIDKLEQLRNGWMEGAGIAPTRGALSRAKAVLARTLVGLPSLPRPKVFPTPSGGVQAEWMLPPWTIDLTFDAEVYVIDALATHSESRTHRERAFTEGQVSSDDSDALNSWLQALR